METHWHVAYGISGYGPDGSDGYQTATTAVDLADLLREELGESSTMANDTANTWGEAKQFESAWHEKAKSEELWNLSATFNNERAKAPLYVNDPAAWDATIIQLARERFPMALDHDDTRRLYAWECSEAECEQAEYCEDCASEPV